jgi:MFS family permease
MRKVNKKKSTPKLTEKHPIIAKKIDKTLDLSIQEGAIATTSSGLGASYLSPFALAMNATSSQIGILHAIVCLFPSITQLYSCKLIETISRKKVLIAGVIFQSLLWIPIILTAILYFNNIPFTIWILIGLVGIFYISIGIVHPAWFSLMGSLVPVENRGKYFSKRNRTMHFCGVLTMILAAIFLDYIKGVGSARGEMILYVLFGFATIFTLSMLLRLYTVGLLFRHYEPRLKIRKKDHLTLKKFIKKSPQTSLGRFTLFTFALRIACGISNPFYIIYLLKDLHFSYMWYIIITVSAIVFQIAFLPLIGKISDKFGNAVLARMAGVFIAFIPLFWAAPHFLQLGSTSTILFLIFVPQLMGGIGWAAFTLATNNYIYDSTRQARQAYYLAYMNLFIGVGAFIGATIGTILLKLNFFTINIIIILFLLSFIARALVILIGSKYLQEVREVKEFSTDFIIHEVHPLRSTLDEIHHLNHLGSRIIHHI